MPDSSTPDIEEYVQQKIASGEFESREQFALEAMRIYRELEARHEQLRTEVQERITQAEQGQVGPLDIGAIKQELVDELDENGQAK